MHWAANDRAGGGPAAVKPDDAVDQQILADPSHPRWEELKRRFEDALALADEEDGY